MKTIKMKPAGSTFYEKILPLWKFKKFKNAIMKSSCNGIKDEIEFELLNNGVSYSDFTVNFTEFDNATFYSLRTINEPMPPALYKPVMKVFKETANWFYRKHNVVATIRLSSEFPRCNGINLKDIEEDKWLFPAIEFLQQQIEYIYKETKYWQMHAGNYNKFLCWPGKCDVTGKWCIYISVHEDTDSFEGYGLISDTEKLRKFIRSLSEYESPKYCVTS